MSTSKSHRSWPSGCGACLLFFFFWGEGGGGPWLLSRSFRAHGADIADAFRAHGARTVGASGRCSGGGRIHSNSRGRMRRQRRGRRHLRRSMFHVVGICVVVAAARPMAQRPPSACFSRGECNQNLTNCTTQRLWRELLRPRSSRRAMYSRARCVCHVAGRTREESDV